jgi:hypothetical protein
MRGLRFGIVAIGLAVLFLGGYGRFLLWRLERRMPPGITHPLPVAADAGLVKADLCRIARAQRAFFASVGRFASTHELSSNGDFSVHTQGRWPYTYNVYNPSPVCFVVVASTAGTALAGQSPAITVDDSMRVCVLKTTLPDFGWRLDHPPEDWGEPRQAYSCEECLPVASSW